MESRANSANLPSKAAGGKNMGWFTPKCPVDDETREWIDASFEWLVDELGIDILRGTRKSIRVASERK